MLAIVLAILHRYTDSDYPFAIFKLFLRFFISILLWRFSSQKWQFYNVYLSIIQNIFENIDSCPASILYYSKKIWRYQKGNQNSTSKKNRQWTMTKIKMINNDLKKTTQNSNDGTTLKNTGELRCNGKGIKSCSTCGTRGVILVTNQVISHEWGKDRTVSKKKVVYMWSFVKQIFCSGLPSHSSDRKTFERMASFTRNPLFSCFFLSSYHSW